MKVSFFDYPTFRYEIPDWEFKKKGLLKRIKEENLERDGQDFYDSDRLTNGNSYVNFLSDLLHPQLEQFYKECECRCTISDAWAVRYNKGDHQTAHCHRAWGFSAVLYVNFDPEVHTPTYFVRPWLDRSGQSYIATPSAREGVMYFYPSSLLHFVVPNKTNKKRLVVAFDLLPQSAAYR